MKINSILPSGIVRNTSNTASKDGQMEELINLRSKDGSLKSIPPMVPVHGLYANEYQNIYIHNNSSYKHLLGAKDNMLYYFADMDDLGTVTMLEEDGIQEITGIKSDASMSQIGNICIFIDSNGIHYLFWRYDVSGNKYSLLNTNYNGNTEDSLTYPEGRLDIRGIGRMDEMYPAVEGHKGLVTTFYGQYHKGVVIDSNNNAISMKDSAIALIAQARAKEKELGRIHGFVMVCSAIELYDGSYILQSRPILINQAVDNRIRFGKITQSDGSVLTDSFENDNESISFYMRFPESGDMDLIEEENIDSMNYRRERKRRSSYQKENDAGGYLNEVYIGDNQYALKDPTLADIPYSPRRYPGHIDTQDWVGRDASVLEQSYVTTLADHIPNFLCEALLVNYGGKDSTLLNLTVQSNKIQFKVSGKIDESFKTIIKSVCIFMTQEVYGQDFDDLAIYGDPSSSIINYIPKKISDETIARNIENLRSFYLIKKIPFEDYNKLLYGTWIDIDLETDAILTNLTAQKELTIDSYSRTSFKPECSILYNGKLHIGNYVEEKFKGFPIEYFFSNNYSRYNIRAYYNNSFPPAYDYGFWLYSDAQPFTIKRSLQKSPIKDTVCYLFTKTTILSETMETSFVYRGHVFKAITGSGDDDFVSEYYSLNPFISYPDINAKYMDIYIYAYSDLQNDWVITYHNKLSLKQSSSFNFSYYMAKDFRPIDMFDAELYDKFLNGTGEVGLPNFSDMNEEVYHNKIRVSSINNPIFFPVENTYTIGNGGLIGFASNTKALSTGQAGAAPLYIFSSDGVYALFVDSSGQLTYTNSRAIARDVCNNAKSITPIDNGVIFTSAVGVMILVGGDVTNISESVKGRYDDFTNISSMDYLKEVAYAFSSGYFAGIKETKEEFLKYIENADIGYNHKENELWITNPASLYSYLYKSGMWTKATQKGKRYVFDYPNCYLMQDNGTMLVLGKEEGFQSVAFLTRPIKLDSQGFKQGYRAIIRTLLETTERTKSIMFGRLYRRNIYANPLLHDSQWRLPTESDVDDLNSFTTRDGNDYLDGGKLKSTSSDYWNAPNTGAENLFGFDVRGAGEFNSTRFIQKYEYSSFWTSGLKNTFLFRYWLEISSIIQTYEPIQMNSIRFCRDLTTSELSLDNGTRLSDYVDFEGNKYIVRKIYNRAWMCENLMTEYLFNGEKIASSDVVAYENDINNVYVNNVTNYNSAIAVYGSYDAKKWAYLGGTSTVFPSRDLGTLIERVDCKYFKIFFASTVSEDSYIDYIDIASDDKLLRQKIR